MSFRKYGGTQFASSHNIVKSNVNTADNFYVTQNVGQPNTYINFESDISGNMNIYGDLDVSGNLQVAGDIDCSGNLQVAGDIDCSGNMNIYGDLDISGNMNIYGDLDISGNLNTNADALINTLTVGKGSGNIVYNTAFGYQALFSNTGGSDNTAVGFLSLKSNTSGSQNTAVGFEALVNTSSGIQNTAIGMYAGYNVVTGSNNTCIGYNAQQSSNIISNEITLGNNNITSLRCYGNLTNPSDARDKKDIKPLDAGLQFIEQLKPVKFIWNMRDGGKVDIPEIGFIAQDLQDIQKDTGITIPNLVYESNPDKLEVSYGTLLPVLIKAVQELSAEVKALKTELNERVKKLEEN
jgi:cytoskeletal protein CcmA (bactofilin family)